MTDPIDAAPHDQAQALAWLDEIARITERASLPRVTKRLDVIRRYLAEHVGPDLAALDASLVVSHGVPPFTPIPVSSAFLDAVAKNVDALSPEVLGTDPIPPPSRLVAVPPLDPPGSGPPEGVTQARDKAVLRALEDGHSHSFQMIRGFMPMEAALSHDQQVSALRNCLARLKAKGLIVPDGTDGRDGYRLAGAGTGTTRRG